MRRLFLRTLVSAVALSCLTAASAFGQSSDRIYATQYRVSSPPPDNFQLLLNLAGDSSVLSTGPVFGPLLSILGLAFLDGLLHGSEFESAANYYLVAFAHEGIFRGQGARVGAAPIGFPNVEGLAVADGTIYGTSIDFGAHRTTLITIDENTGIGAAVGMPSRNVIIEGLAYDPLNELLYGAGVPFGAGEPNAVDDNNLYILDMNDAGETLVGDLGTRIEGLAWDQELGLIGSFDRLYSIDDQTGAATPLGPTDFTDGLPGTFNGAWGLASLITSLGQGICGDANNDTNVNATDALITLQTGVGAGSCPLCVCDVNSSTDTNATDALLALQFGVGQPVVLNCVPC